MAFHLFASWTFPVVASRASVIATKQRVADTAEEQLFRILDGCPLLSRIDLTTCRGINVRNRRRVFDVWAEARAQHE